MADSIEVLRAALRYIEHTANGKQELLVEQMRNAIRALSPAGGDWVASGFIRVGLTDVLVSDELSDFVGRKEVSREVHSMIHEDTRNDPHEFGAGIEDNPKAKYWQQRAAFWRETAKALGYVPPGEAIAASPQQEPGAVRDLTECGHSKYDPCHNCEPTTADESGPAINSAETYSKPIADPSGQTLAGAGGDDAAMAYVRDWCPDHVKEYVAKLTATSAGTTGDDSEDALAYREAIEDAILIGADFNTGADASDWLRDELASIDAARRARGESA